jgi:HK97 family phage major capsid protein
MKVTAHYKRYSDEADALSQSTPTPQSRERLRFLLSSMATMRENGMHEEKEAEVVRTALQSAMEFRTKFLSKEATRSYTPLSESTGASLIPSDFEVQLKQTMLADGPLFAGSPLLTNLYAKTMDTTKIAVNDDSNVGSISEENVGFPTDDAELTGLNGVTIGGNSKNYSSGILLASMSLAADAPNFTRSILKMVSPRLSRIQNATFLAALKTALGLNSSAAVAAAGSTIAAADVYTLASAVASPYRAQAAWVMSAAKQTALGALKTSSGGQREFPNVLEAKPTLLGYPVHIIAQADDDDILLGDFSYLYGKSTPVVLKVLTERFLLQGYYGYLLSERADVKWTVAASSDSPVKYLTFA